MEKGNKSSTVQRDEKSTKKKITIVVDEDDPCIKKDKIEEEAPQTLTLSRAAGIDPRYTHKVIL